MTGTTRLAPGVAVKRLAELGAPGDPRDYRVDGLEPMVALVPETPEAVAEALAVCAAAGLVVIPWGGGRQMGLGNLPERYDVALDMRSLSAITHYEPDDLTIAVQAGRSVASLSSELAAHGQMLPIEAADPERVTIGGLVATGVGCPRRFGYGSLRDLIIGITIALPDGTLARGGGIVVKNVSGYDMMRLHFGALGSLGVIIQANFKVLPAPEAQRTLLFSFRESDQAAAAALSLRTSQLAPTALVVLAPSAAQRLADSERWILAARCEGPEGAVERQVERLRASVETASAETAVLDERKTLAFWSSLQGELEATPFERDLRVRIGELPSRLGELAAQLERRCGSALRSLVLDSGSGLAYATVSGEPVELRALWGELRELGRHTTLLGAPIEVKTGEDVFGRHPEGIAVMRRLKATFDPERILNRGRFIAHL